MNGLNRKLHELEGKALNDDVKEDTCFLDMTSLPETERQIHKIAQEICKYHNEGEKPTPEDRAIVEHSSRLITLRVFYLFRKMVKTLYFLKDSPYEDMFDLRFMWFLKEASKLGDQTLELYELRDANPGLHEDELDAKECELEETFEETWTEQSYQDYERKAYAELFKSFTPERLEELKKKNGTKSV